MPASCQGRRKDHRPDDARRPFSAPRPWGDVIDAANTTAPNMRNRNLILIAILLLALTLPGMLRVLLAHHTSTAQSVLVWISVVAFAGGALMLLVVGLRALRRARTRP
jgi:hypothetical protein